MKTHSQVSWQVDGVERDELEVDVLEHAASASRESQSREREGGDRQGAALRATRPATWRMFALHS